MTYRLRNILIAVGLAVVAALLTVFYVSNYKSSVRSDSETVSVLVAAQDIPQGMLGQQIIERKMLATQEIPRKAIVNGTIAAPEDISGLIATQPIYIGEQVTARRFGPLEAAGVRDQLRGTWRVMQIKGNDAQLLSGVLTPGDHVDVIGNIKFPSEDGQKHFSKVVLIDVLVLRTSGEDETQASVVDPNWRRRLGHAAPHRRAGTEALLRLRQQRLVDGASARPERCHEPGRSVDRRRRQHPQGRARQRQGNFPTGRG